MSTTMRQFALRALRRTRVKRFQAISGLKHKYVCHLGDQAGENPFYNLDADRLGITLMSAWCSEEENPIVYDVGANLGFVSTQIAQILNQYNQPPVIVAFEPVWSTFEKLKYSIRSLGLENFVIPVCCAISDKSGFSAISFDESRSLFAQLGADTSNKRVGANSSIVPTSTLDSAIEAFPCPPTLLKIDVEGFEAHVIRGATTTLSSELPPAIFLEWNPLTMREIGTSPCEIPQILSEWSFFYVDDFENQKEPFGQEIRDLSSIDWVCNVFAVPPIRTSQERWKTIRGKLSKKDFRSI